MTGRDVAIAAMLGAEEFGFSTAPLLVMGCIMMRVCHLNTCPVGIATQDVELRKKFKGRPEDVVTFLIHTAEQVRRALAELGFRSLGEAVGRVDRLRVRAGAAFPKGAMDLAALLADADPAGALPRAAADMRSRVDPDAGSALAGGSNWRNLDDIVWRTCADAVEERRRPRAPGAPPQPSLTLHFPIRNCARSVGARLSGEIARRFGLVGLPDGAIGLHFHGIAGQSFGAFCNRGMKLVLRGEAHDYVGKSMYGGVIVLAPQAAPTLVAAEGDDAAAAAAAAPPPPPPPPSPTAAAAADTLASFVQPPRKENIICGNTVLYGATGGRLFAAGSAGERFAVRNSGAVAVVEGLGDHGCEYMTNGTVVVLGATGRNFAAGMSGGEAFVLDVADAFLDAYNPGMVEATRVEKGSAAEARLLALLREHVAETGSGYGRHVLAHWAEARDIFWHVLPNRTPAKANSQALLHVPSWTSRRRALASAGAGAADADATALPRLLSMQHYSTAAAAAADDDAPAAKLR
jgi:glutamate synthase domain-containing protein 3